MAEVTFQFAAGSDRTITFPATSMTLGSGGGGSSPTKQTITDGSTITLAWLHGSMNVVTLGGNRTWAFSGTPAVEEELKIRIIQDATGGRTVTWPTSGVTINWVGDAGTPVLTTTPDKADVIGLRCTDDTSGALRFEGWVSSQNGAV